MRRLGRTALLALAGAVLPYAWAPAAAPVAAAGGDAEGSEGRHAFRSIRIIYDPTAWAVGGLLTKAGGSGFRSTVERLGEEVLRRRFAIPERVPTSRCGRLTITYQLIGREEYRPKPNTMAVRMLLDLTLAAGQEPVAGQLLDEIVERLRVMLAERHEAYTADLRKRIVEITAKLAGDKAELEKVRPAEQGLAKRLPRSIDYEEVDYQFKQHSRSVDALRLELAGKRARRDAALRKIAEIRDAAVTKAAGDPVAAELEKLVQIRQEEVKRQEELVRAGVANMTSVQATQGNLAEARVRLIERKEKIAELAGGAVLVKLNEELATLSLDTVELEAKEKMTAGLLAELRRLREDKLAHSEAVARIAQLQDAVAANSGKPEDLSRRLEESEPPSLTVVSKAPPTTPAPGGGGGAKP
jgi:hypothetical protein